MNDLDLLKFKTILNGWTKFSNVGLKITSEKVSDIIIDLLQTIYYHNFIYNIVVTNKKEVER